MAKTIWKYTLKPEITLSMPEGARVLSVQLQHEEICLWALVDTDAEEAEDRSFIVYGTGHAVTYDARNLKFIGTVLMNGGALVWHIFEIFED